MSVLLMGGSETLKWAPMMLHSEGAESVAPLSGGQYTVHPGSLLKWNPSWTSLPVGLVFHGDRW